MKEEIIIKINRRKAEVVLSNRMLNSKHRMNLIEYLSHYVDNVSWRVRTRKLKEKDGI